MNLLLRLIPKFSSWIQSCRSLRCFLLLFKRNVNDLSAMEFCLHWVQLEFLVHHLLWLLRISLPNHGVIVLFTLIVVSKGILWKNAINSMGIPQYINPNKNSLNPKAKSIKRLELFLNNWTKNLHWVHSLQLNVNNSLHYWALNCKEAPLPLLLLRQGLLFPASVVILSLLWIFPFLLPLGFWILVQHITFFCSLSLFSHSIFISNSCVTLSNGHFVPITCIGTIVLSPTFTLHDVLFIPQFKFNLVSVSALNQNYSYYVTFLSTSCVIQDPT